MGLSSLWARSQPNSFPYVSAPPGPNVSTTSKRTAELVGGIGDTIDVEIHNHVWFGNFRRIAKFGEQ